MKVNINGVWATVAGLKGKSAYEQAIDGGFTGSESDFASGLGQINEVVDTPIRRGAVETAVVGGKDSVAWSEGSHAEGVDAIAGIKGYSFATSEDGNIVGNYTTTTITLEGANDRMAELTDKVVSVCNGSKYENSIRVVSVDGYVLRYVLVDPNVNPFAKKITLKEADKSTDDFTIWCHDIPDIGNIDLGWASHASGDGAKATNRASHAEGRDTHAFGQYAHAEGRQNKAGYCAHAEGRNVEAFGEHSHAEGNKTKAHGKDSHAEGKETVASGIEAHAEGQWTQAVGDQSHAEGESTIASGNHSHAEGLGTVANNNSEHACGMYNVSTVGQTMFSVGIGTSKVRKNAVEVDKNGNIYIWFNGEYKILQDILAELQN